MSALQSELEQALANNRSAVQATLLGGPGVLGAKMLVLRADEWRGTLGDARLDAAVMTAALDLLREGKGDAAATRTFAEGDARVYLELFMPPPHLIIFGGVHIAIPLCHYAKILGFRITLADPRTTFANADRFPMVDTIIPEWPDEAMAYLQITPSTYIVILTHDPKLDEPALEAVLGKGAAYVGAIGSRKTHAERFGRMAKLGIGAEQLAEVYAPIGLDLNGNNPEEVALAIMAEIIAVRRGGSGGFLKGRKPDESSDR